MSGHNGLYFTLLRHDLDGVLEKQSVRVCELPRGLLLHFSFAEVQHAVQSLATGRELAPPALRDVNTYCDEAAMLYGQGSRDAAHFLGRALEVCTGLNLYGAWRMQEICLTSCGFGPDLGREAWLGDEPSPGEALWSWQKCSVANAHVAARCGQHSML